MERTPPCRVLIVDDCRFTRKLICNFLKDSGEFEVVAEAADGKEGLEKAAEFHPDVLCVDVDMPKLSGLEMISRLREKSQVPVVLITALPKESEDLRRCLEGLDVSEIVPKQISYHPLDLCLFEEDLRAALRRSVALSENTHADEESREFGDFHLYNPQ